MRRLYTYLLLSLLGALLPSASQAAPGSLRLAVLGDSSSHGYQDRLAFPPGTAERGGPYRAITLQWTEVLDRLRGSALDLGRHGIWGQRRTIARLRDWLGLRSRWPEKEDHEFNLAFSGARCRDLLEGVGRQAPRLAELIAQDAPAWRQGLVVIRLGANDLGTSAIMDRMAAEPSDPTLVALADDCAARVEQAVALLRKVQPELRFVVFPPPNESDDAIDQQRWASALAQRRIADVLAVASGRLQRWAMHDPQVLYVDENAWVARLWGGRDRNGQPAYHPAKLGEVLDIPFTAGNAPDHVELPDGHASLAYNALFAQFVLAQMQSRWSLPLTPISEAELQAFVRGLLQSAGWHAARS